VHERARRRRDHGALHGLEVGDVALHEAHARAGLRAHEVADAARVAAEVEHHGTSPRSSSCLTTQAPMHPSAPVTK
jgi:hypothetical protein